MSLTSTQRIEEVKKNIIDNALIYGALAGLLTYLISLSKFYTTGFEPSFVTDLIIVLLISVIAYHRKRINIKVKSYIILIGIYTIILVEVYELGILSANKVLLILIPFLAVFTFSIRQTLLSLFALLGIIGIIAYFHIEGSITPISGDTNSLTAWIINIILILLVSFILLFTVMKFNSTYESLIKDLIASNKETEKSEKNYREIFNATSDAIVILDSDYKIFDFNESFEVIFGNHGKTPSLKSMVDTNDVYSYEHFIKKFSDVRFERREIFDWQIEAGNDNIRWFEISLKKALIGNRDCFLCIFRDNHDKKLTALELETHKNQLELLVEKRTKTLMNQKNELKLTLDKLKETQDRLLQSEKMASLGLLASGVAHEINNPLNFIKGGIHSIEEYFKDHSKEHYNNIRELIDGVNSGVERASKIVTGLSLYGREKDKSNEACDVVQILNNCITIINNEIRGRIEVRKEYGDIPLKIQGNVGQLHQVFLNLLTNSIHAIKERGTITIEVVKNMSDIEIKISDTGVGIAKNILPRISDPFFTTKQVGEGTGLGLYIVFNIIHEHNGTIVFKSKKGIGTTVIISLPNN